MLLSKTRLDFCSTKAPIANEGGEGGLLQGCKHSSVVTASAMCAAQHLGETSLGEISILSHVSWKKMFFFKFTYNAVFHVQSNCLTSSEQTAYIGCSFLLITC